MRKAKIFFKDKFAGILSEDEDGFHFRYDREYIHSDKPQSISLTLPLRVKVYNNNILHPFFDGLIPEGWLLDIAEKNWKINSRDRMELLLACCKDCIGAVSVEPLETQES